MPPYTNGVGLASYCFSRMASATRHTRARGGGTTAFTRGWYSRWSGWSGDSVGAYSGTTTTNGRAWTRLNHRSSCTVLGSVLSTFRTRSCRSDKSYGY